jgi:hypothetical protein
MLKKLPFFLGLLALSGVADAGIVYSPPAPLPSVAQNPVVPQSPPINLKGYSEVVNRAPHLIQSGVANPTSCNGFSHSMPMKDALKAILPEGWKVYAKNGVNVGIPVSYTCEHDITWTQAVNSMMDQTGLQGHIHWDRDILTVNYYPIPVGVAVPVSNKPLSTSQGFVSSKLPLAIKHVASTAAKNSGTTGLNKKWFHVGKAVYTTTKSASANTTPASYHAVNPLAHAIPVFVMRKGDLILTDLQKWGTQSGWTVVWKLSRDWIVPSTTSFTGSFKTSVGSVVHALNSSGSNLAVKFYNGNNTVVIKSLTH